MSSDILDIKESPPLKVKRQILPSKDDGFIGSYASSYAGGYTQNVIKTGEELLKGYDEYINVNLDFYNEKMNALELFYAEYDEFIKDIE